MPIPSLSDHALVVFNFLPSRTLHPSRFQDYGSEPYAVATARMPALSGIWHRHWSRKILEREGLLEMPVTDIVAPGLPVAVLPPTALAVLARRIGAVLCAPRLRYAITGDAVRALQDALGVEILRLARNGRSLHPGLPGAMFTDIGEAVRTVDNTGYAALCCAFGSTKPEVARRMRLKLPLAIDSEPTTSIDGECAMALATALVPDPSARGGDDVFD